MYLIPGIYVFLCLVVGWIGRWSRLGFWGVLLLSLVLTPAISIFLVLFLSDRSRRFISLFNKSKNKMGATDITEAPVVTHADDLK